MKSYFTHPLFEIFITLLLVGYLFWNISMILYAGNIKAIIPGTIQLITLVLMLFRSRFLKKAMKIWSIIFIIIGFAGIFSKVLLHLSRDSESINLLNNGTTLAIGILVWYIADQKIKILPKK